MADVRDLHADPHFGEHDARRRALALWPRLDRRKLTRTCGDPVRVARLVSKRTSMPVESILVLLVGRAVE